MIASRPAPWREWAWTTALVMLTTVVVTWPLAFHAWQIPSHQDPLFSVWRLYQWARNLAERPGSFDGNIFYPAEDVLLYSDAIALPAVVAAPFLWAGVPPLLVYDGLVWMSFVSAGLAMYLFARDLTGSRAAGRVGAVIITGAPYRLEHVYHLELLWTCWMPLALWAVWRVFQGTRPAARYLALALLAQLLSCIYYGLYLLTVLPVVTAVAWAMRPFRMPRQMLLRLVAAGLLVAIGAAAYGRPYTRARGRLGDRSEAEIRSYSAELINFAATPSGNRVWGWTADRIGSRERRLSCGVVAYALVVPALLAPVQPWTVGLLAGTLFAVDGARGLNGVVYPALLQASSLFRGLRVPARFGGLVLALVAALAAVGVARLEGRITARAWPLVLFTLIALLLAEYANAHHTRALPTRAPSVYAWLAGQPATVIAHFPMPRPEALPGPEADFQYFAQFHRHQLVNGNSGYYPGTYIQLIERARRFPDERSLTALRNLGVTLLIVHAQHYEDPQEYQRVAEELRVAPGVEFVDVFTDEAGAARVYRLRR